MESDRGGRESENTDRDQDVQGKCSMRVLTSSKDFTMWKSQTNFHNNMNKIASNLRWICSAFPRIYDFSDLDVESDLKQMIDTLT